MADSKRYQESEEGGWFAGFDPVEEVLGRPVGEARQGQELLLGQMVEVGRVPDQLPVDQLLQCGVAKALDIQRTNEVA